MSERPEISVVVPALNEGENLSFLVERTSRALAGRSFEILIIDDGSRDNTRAVCAELAKRYPMQLVEREQPKDGLGGAVLHGFKLAQGDFLVVMDADLQHPPERLPELVAPLERNEADFVLGSRFVSGGSTGEKWGVLRKINSWVATRLARPFSGNTRDPMSGFFALRRGTYEQAERLTPLGYKIGLELMCKTRASAIREIPIHFRHRERGESKLTLREQFRYLEHLSRLYDYTYPRLSPIAKFLIVTVLSWLVGLGAYMLMIESVAGPAISVMVAYAVAILVTAVFHNRYIRAQREFLLTRRPWAEFIMVALAEIAVVAATAEYVVLRVRDAHAWEIFLITFAAGTVTRYVLRKEFMLDIRGLRRELRREELR